MTEKSWNIGGPGGPAGPFYSVVKPDGQIVAMQILTQEMAELIASIPQLQAEVERLREALTRINVLADPYRESEAWASPEAYSRWAAQIASEALNG